MKNIFNYLLYGLFFVAFANCIGHSKRDSCKISYKTARAVLNSYYHSNDQTELLTALEDVNRSMQCPETRAASIELKISLLSLLKRFREGYQFVDSLSGSDFEKSYKKKTYSNFFTALEYESMLDMSQIKIEIDSLKAKYPAERDFFHGVIGTIDSSTKSVEAMPKVDGTDGL